MTTQNIALFKALGAKMSYLDQRQKVISQNVANADTPGYQPKDLTAVDFGRVLKDVARTNVLNPETTNPMHLPAVGEIADPDRKEQKITYEIAPAGNAVVLEEQMMMSAKNSMDYNLMTTLYQKNVSLIRTALGRGQ